MAPPHRDILSLICQVVWEENKYLSVQVWENSPSLSDAAKYSLMTDEVSIHSLSSCSCWSRSLYILSFRSAEGLPARAALPADHQAAVWSSVGVHGHEASADWGVGLREWPGRLRAHRQPAGQPSGGGEGEEDKLLLLSSHDIIVPEYRRWGGGERDNRGTDNDGFNTADLTSVTSACAPGDISGGIQCTSLEQSYFTHLGQMTKSLKFDCNWISLGYYYDFFCLFCTSHITLLLKLWLQTLSTSLQLYFEGRICPKNWQNTQ